MMLNTKRKNRYVLLLAVSLLASAGLALALVRPPQEREADRRLFMSIVNNDATGVRAALAMGANPNAPAPPPVFDSFLDRCKAFFHGARRRETALHFAYVNRNIMSCPSIPARDAARNAACDDVIRVLLEAGAREEPSE